MYLRAMGHQSVNSVARSIPGAYRELVIRLCELHGVAVARFEGTAFVRDADVAALRVHVADWLGRPRLKLHARRKLRARRRYRLWHPKHRDHPQFWEKSVAPAPARADLEA